MGEEEFGFGDGALPVRSACGVNVSFGGDLTRLWGGGKSGVFGRGEGEERTF